MGLLTHNARNCETGFDASAGVPGIGRFAVTSASMCRSIKAKAHRATRCATPLVFQALLVAAFAGVNSAALAESAPSYGLDFTITLERDKDVARVEARVIQSAHDLQEVRWRRGAAEDFEGDGEIRDEGDLVAWFVPAKGGRIRFEVPVRNRRSDKGFDAWIGEDWAIFRGDDIVPSARTLTSDGALSRTRLKIVTPDGWSSITPYPKGDDGWYRVNRPERRFDRPVGWMAAGRLGVRRATIDGVDVAVAGPVGLGLRRMDTLAFLNWNLPALTEVFDSFPRQLLVLSAGEPMWRGGLSGPSSLFLHQTRPLISENGTSTLMHELMHLAQGYRAADGADWIVEGLAEFYSIEFMRRTGTLPASQAERAFASQRDWGKDVDDLRTDRSTGAVTARAAVLFAQLDEEVRRATAGEATLDDVARKLSGAGVPVDLAGLRGAAEAVTGAPSSVLADGKVPGY